MRSLKAIFVLIGLILTMTIFMFSNDSKVRVMVSSANIRLKPTTQSAVVIRIPIGAVLDVIRQEGNWYLIKLPPDEKGIVVTGYIHESIVEITEKIEEFKIRKEPEKKKESEIIPIKKKKESLIPEKNTYIPVQQKDPSSSIQEVESMQYKKKPRFFYTTSLGLAFPTGEWADFFRLGLGIDAGLGYPLIQNPHFQLELIGGVEGFLFLRKTGYYSEISWTRVAVAADARFNIKMNPVSIFFLGGLGLYLDILDVEYLFWREDLGSEFVIGPRLGGGISFGKFEIKALYHLVERNMLAVMGAYTFRF